MTTPTDPTPRTAATAREALEAICAAHYNDPDGGMGYTSAGYGTFETACVVCGTSDEYAVEWPCWTWTTANAGLIALAAAERLSAIRKELEGWEHGEECAAWTDPDAACCAHPGCMKRSRGAVVHKSPETCCAGKPCASPADHHPFTPAAKCPDCRHALTEHAKRPNAGGCRHEALTGNNCPCWRWISDEVETCDHEWFEDMNVGSVAPMRRCRLCRVVTAA